MDNPTRNQSLHSYWGNRWANMFPGVCPYYSTASGPPGDSRARWNWGVVTTEWTGNELLQNKWSATWEMRNPPTKHGDRGWVAASTSTFFPQLHSATNITFFLNRQRLSAWDKVWMARRRMNEQGPLSNGDRYRFTYFGFMNSISAPTKGIFRIAWNYMIHVTWC